MKQKIKFIKSEIQKTDRYIKYLQEKIISEEKEKEMLIKILEALK